MKKRLFSGMLAGAVTVTSVFTGFGAPVQAEAATFSDISEHWAKAYIEEAASEGIISGYPDGTFNPDAPVKRSEFTKMVNNTLGNSSTTNITFKDVPSYEWYYTDVSKAVAAGYAGGYDTGDFKPDSYISRQEAAVMLSRIVPAADSSANISAYKDKANVGEWAESSLSRIVGKKYMGAYDDGLLHPLDNLTRAQAAKILVDIADKEKIVKTALTVKDEDTELSGRIYSNGVTIHKDVADGAVKIDNCVVLGAMYVQGGGSGDDYIDIVDSRIADLQVSKSASAVKIRAKDDTRILSTSIWKEALLETSSLDGGLFGTGFDRINIYGSGDVTLDGNFPAVDIKGSGAVCDFAAGTITTVTIDAAGKNSEVILGDYATVTTADVNGAAAFKGTGKIKTMNANVSGITYETKPEKVVTKTGVTGPTYSDASLNISISPGKGDTDVDIASDIVLSFASAIKKYNGKAIANDDLESMIELRKGSSSGTKIAFSATINSTKKKVTITPDSVLDYNTKYYVIMKADTVKDADGEGNDAFSAYFTTEKEETADIAVSPKHKATNVGVSDNITLTFAVAMRMRDNSALTSSNLDDVIELRKGSSSGTKIGFSASINSAKKVVTINPTSNLDYSTKYYVVIDRNAIEDSSGNGNAAFSSYFTTADYAYKISSITANSNENSITATVTPTQNGDVYAVLVAKGAKAPSADQIMAGKDGDDASALRVVGKTGVTKNVAKTLTAFTGLDDSKEYVVYCVLKSGSNVSPVASKNVSTTAPSIPDATLTGLDVAGKKSMSPAFAAGTTEYDVVMPFGATTASVTATAGSGVTVLYSSTGADGSWSTDALADAALDASKITKLYVKVQESGKHDCVYTLNVEVEGNVKKSAVVVMAGGEVAPGNELDTFFMVPFGTTSVEVELYAMDTYATVICEQLTAKSDILAGIRGTLALSESSDTTTVTFKIKSNLDEAEYEFSVMVLADETAEDEGAGGGEGAGSGEGGGTGGGAGGSEGSGEGDGTSPSAIE